MSTRVERAYALREWIGRALPDARHGYAFVWRRTVAEWMVRVARRGRVPEFATTTVANAVAGTPGACVVELEPEASALFPLPRLHTTRRWLLRANPPPRVLAWPSMRVIDLPNGVVFGHDGAVGPDSNTIVTDLGFVYAISPRELFRRAAPSREKGLEHLAGTTVSMLQLHPSNHAHALMQGVPRLDLIRRAIDLDEVDRVLVNASAARVLRAAIERVGFGPDRVVEVPDDTVQFVCDRVLAATAIPLNCGTPPWGLTFARRLFPAQDDRAERPRLIFVEREDGDVRGVVNASEVRSALAQRGFVAVTMANRSFEEQAAIFAAADVIVALHGAALANLVYARPGTHVIELVGANTLNWTFPPLSWAAGLEHDVLVGTEPAPPPRFWTWQKDGDQVVDVVRLGQLVDAALARVDARA